MLQITHISENTGRKANCTHKQYSNAGGLQIGSALDDENDRRESKRVGRYEEKSETYPRL